MLTNYINAAVTQHFCDTFNLFLIFVFKDDDVAWSKLFAPSPSYNQCFGGQYWDHAVAKDTPNYDGRSELHCLSLFGGPKYISDLVYHFQ